MGKLENQQERQQYTSALCIWVMVVHQPYIYIIVMILLVLPMQPKRSLVYICANRGPLSRGALYLKTIIPIDGTTSIKWAQSTVPGCAILWLKAGDTVYRAF